MRGKHRPSAYIPLLIGGLVAASALTVAPAEPALAATPFEAKGSVEQVYVTGLASGATVTLHDSGGSQVASREANSLGGSLFRLVPHSLTQRK